MKKVLPILLSVIVVISIFTAMALGTNATDVDPVYYVSGDYTYTVCGTTDAKIVGYSGADTELTIPDTLDEYKVKAIDDFAFMQNTALTSVLVPSTVVIVNEYAFLEATFASITIYNAECELFDSEYTIPQTATIYGYDNSTAQAYAEKYERVFVSLGETPVVPTSPESTEATQPTQAETNEESTGATEVLPTETVPETQPQLVLGDVDGDGEVSVMDATAIQLHLAAIQLLSDENLSAGDADRDGEVSVLDATQIQLYVAKLIESL